MRLAQPRRGQCRLGAGREALTVRVSDTGVGMTDERMRRIREHIDGTSDIEIKSERGGDGLGLIGVGRMMRSIGGTLELASSKDGGAREPQRHLRREYGVSLHG